MKLRVTGGKPLKGAVRIPADKSIVHRALLFNAMAEGEATVDAFEPGDDNRSTAAILQALGSDVQPTPNGWKVGAAGLDAWAPPENPLDCGNSGTTMRLLVGALAGRGLTSSLVGDASLMSRPMGRVCDPLRALGASVSGRVAGGKEYAPLQVATGNFEGGLSSSSLASAQVKSCVLLAGVSAGKPVSISQPMTSRDHTERLLRAMGTELTVTHTGEGVTVAVQPGALRAVDCSVPGDISSAAFWIALGLMIPESEFILTGVGLNESRSGMLQVVGEDRVEVSASRESGGEPVGDLHLRYGALENDTWEIGGQLVPRLIDELVVLGGLATQNQGGMVVRGASELRVKESDRVTETVRLVRAFGGQAEARPDGFAVEGGTSLKATQIDVGSDHRVALAGLVMALAARGTSELDGYEVANVSYPGFVSALQTAGAEIEVLT